MNRMITWDENKRQRVLKDHEVDFARIEDIFDDAFGIYFDDDIHSTVETRRSLIGITAAYGLILLVYVVRDGNFHLITARRASGWLARRYEKQYAE